MGPLAKPPDRATIRHAFLDNHLTSVLGADVLDDTVLRSYGSNAFRPVSGWSVSRRFSDGQDRRLRLLVDGNFPYSPPRVAVVPAPKFLSWPHLEEDGRLCVYSDEATVDSSDIIGVAGAFLNRAALLIERILGGNCDDDFRDEFRTYWNSTVDPGSRSVLSLVRPRGPTRSIFVWRGTAYDVIADDSDALRRWLEHHGVPSSGARGYKFSPGVLLWLPDVLLPREYPKTNSDIARIARSTKSDFTGIWPCALSAPQPTVPVVLAASGSRGVCFAAVSLCRTKSLNDGFRKQREIPKMVVDRYLSSGSRVHHHSVHRVDHRWVHSRGGDSDQDRLSSARVAFVGCGSLGGMTAFSIAQSGIGHLLLVDPESLEAANTGRHLLGVESLHRKKAEAVRDRLLRAFPHINNVEAEATSLAPTNDTLLAHLAQCELVVSTTGDWATESFLNDHQRNTDGFPPVLYGWIEAHAAAAHAVLIKPDGACLRCGRTATGRPRCSVTTWPDDADMEQEPACGARFTPYGPAELTWAHALIVRAVLLALLDPPDASHHYIWIGHERTMKRAGGEWTPEWHSTRGEIGLGGFTEDRSWTVDSRCESLGHRLPE